MNPKIFWSWQSDKPGKVSRHFLKDVLEEAIKLAGEALDLNESERPGIDHDTKGEPGLVSIPDSILAKIDAAAVFVADLTPVACGDTGRHVANPNVLIELGYAKKALGPAQIILIWNSAWGGCEPDDLPFDLRHRRMPFTYSLDPSATKDKIASVRQTLVRDLKDAIISCLSRVQRTAVNNTAISGVPHREGDPSVWFPKDQLLTVNNATSFGADNIRFPDAPRSYLRIIPASWDTDVRPHVIREDQTVSFEPLGNSMGFSWGRTKGGAIVYRVGDREENAVSSLTATQWFAASGELWGFDSHIMFTDDRGRQALATDYVVKCWSHFLRKASAFYAHYGNKGPFLVTGGLTEIKGAIWPPDMWGEAIYALEDHALHSETVADLNATTQRALLERLHNIVRDAFGLDPSPSELEKILKGSR